jgi:hypothetical protein
VGARAQERALREVSLYKAREGTAVGSIDDTKKTRPGLRGGETAPDLGRARRRERRVWVSVRPQLDHSHVIPPRPSADFAEPSDSSSRGLSSVDLCRLPAASGQPRRQTRCCSPFSC